MERHKAALNIVHKERSVTVATWPHGPGVGKTFLFSLAGKGGQLFLIAVNELDNFWQVLMVFRPLS